MADTTEAYPAFSYKNKLLATSDVEETRHHSEIPEKIFRGLMVKQEVSDQDNWEYDNGGLLQELQKSYFQRQGFYKELNETAEEKKEEDNAELQMSLCDIVQEVEKKLSPEKRDVFSENLQESSCVNLLSMNQTVNELTVRNLAADGGYSTMDPGILYTLQLEGQHEAYSCTICGKLYSDYYGLETHMLSRHSDTDDDIDIVSLPLLENQDAPNNLEISEVAVAEPVVQQKLSGKPGKNMSARRHKSAVKTKLQHQCRNKASQTQKNISPKSNPNKKVSAVKKTALSMKKILDNRNKNQEKKLTHNILERQRRMGLTKLYGLLKVCIPELKDTSRASKVMVLEKARLFILNLEKEEGQLIALKEEEQRKRRLLANRIFGLRNCKKLR